MEVIYHEHQLESAIKEWPILDGYCIRRHHGRVLYFKPLRRCAGDHGQPDRGCGKAGFDDSGRDRDHL